MHENIQTLMSDGVDERLLIAAMKVPPEMAGLTPEVKDRIEEHLLKQRHAAEFKTIEAIDGTSELMNSAVEMGLYQLRQAAGFGENNRNAFDEWMQRASRDQFRAA